jgi:nitronate monooxygenase
MKIPRIIQGGMGLGISDWRLARAVSTHGQLGVVSGTAIDLILIRRLQAGDPGGHMRRALAAFPDPRIAGEIVGRYFIEGGKPAGQPFATKPMVGEKHGRPLAELLVAANFVEVHLAKEGHGGMVGINYLHKIQTPTLPSLLGAMLAGVDVVLMGAGIPVEIPAILDRIARGEPVTLDLHVSGATRPHVLSLDPADLLPGVTFPLRRPRFLPIVSSVTLATMLMKKSKGRIDGFVVEEPSAGGHNAPPRGPLKLSATGEPVYGPRDAIDPAGLRALGLPFWLAGSYGTPERLAEALASGAAGVQLGTLFALCEESGLRADLKRAAIGEALHGTARVFRDPRASPTGFPFQVLSLPGTLSEAEVYADRCRQCDLGYLREAYERPDGTLGWRCPAEDPESYVKKGGNLEDTIGRKCLCNGLIANIGLAQHRDGKEELPLVTCGADLSAIAALLPAGRDSYSAAEVLDFLLAAPAMACA